MSNQVPAIGSIGWIDLTTGEADRLRDFYRSVVGWSAQPVSMGNYNDYTMCTNEGTPAAGICHKRGVNESLPSQWMIYIIVADLDQSLAAVTSHGGAVVKAATSMGPTGRYAVISDPGGAVCALFQPAP